MQKLIDDIGNAIKFIDQSGIPFKKFQPGVGPYGEPQLVKYIGQELSSKHNGLYQGARTCRMPDLLIPNHWALEFKIVRPFGDNGIEAEHWSENLLHPYAGNVSAIGDSMKLLKYAGCEARGLIVISYEHDLPKVDLSVLISAFEMLSRQLLQLPLGERHTTVVDNCIHPIHQRATVYGWMLG
jgi:hypothetical protein